MGCGKLKRQNITLSCISNGDAGYDKIVYIIYCQNPEKEFQTQCGDIVYNSRHEPDINILSSIMEGWQGE